MESACVLPLQFAHASDGAAVKSSSQAFASKTVCSKGGERALPASGLLGRALSALREGVRDRFEAGPSRRKAFTFRMRGRDARSQGVG